tara:strand:- start:50327 stop:51208 length:882 start_codon:yes stop_codon:yes gene_type:complete
MAKCLVTGHKGYIGTKLFNKLKKDGHEVLGIDLKSKESMDILYYLKEDSDGKFHPLFWNFQPEYIFHMACFPRVGFSIENPVSTMKNNVLIGSYVLNFARKCPSVKRLIYSSSSSVVGNGEGPTSPYALHKYTTEVECKIYSRIYNLDTVSLRYFNVYSEDQKTNGAYATAVSNWMHHIKTNRKPFITGTGEQRRDMIHVDDVISANIFCMNRKQNFHGHHFDVGTGKNISLNEIKNIVQKYHNVEFNYIESRPGDVQFTKADISKLKEIGWSAKTSICDGINNCFKNLVSEK